MYSTDAMEYGVYSFGFGREEPFDWVYPVCCGYGAAETEKSPASGGGAVLYLLEGAGRVRLAGEERPYGADCVAFAQSASDLTLLPDQRTEYLFLALQNASGLLSRLSRGGFLREIKGSCRADRLLGRICYNASIHRPAGVFNSSADAYALLMELMEHLENEQASYPPLVQEALRIIRQDFAFLNGVDELADRLAVSREHLIRSFRTATGQSPGQCLQSVKLDNARLMLQNRDYSIEMVADMAGYSGANYFCKVFRRATGESPGEYRARTLSNPPADPESQRKLEKIEGIYHI